MNHTPVLTCALPRYNCNSSPVSDPVNTDCHKRDLTNAVSDVPENSCADAITSSNTQAAAASSPHSVGTCTPTRLSLIQLSENQRAKRVRFYRNGDRFFCGMMFALAPHRYRTWDSLLSALNCSMLVRHRVPVLSSGVRSVFTLQGDRVSSLEQLEEGHSYVCATAGECFKPFDYLTACQPIAWSFGAAGVCSPTTVTQTTSSSDTKRPFVRPRIITVLRGNTPRPRRVVRFLLNRRTAHSLEQVLQLLSDVVQLDAGSIVRLVSRLRGEPVRQLEDLFPANNDDDDVFIAYGTAHFRADDFELHPEELKWLPRRSNVSNTRTFLLRSGRIDSFIRDKYSIESKIGDGNFADVFKCRDRRNLDTYLAMKVIYRARLKGKQHMIDSEIAILRTVTHSNIVKLHDVYYGSVGSNTICLVMEYVPGGDLFDAIASQKCFAEDRVSWILADLASALDYLHTRMIVHRDIKPENILLATVPSQSRAEPYAYSTLKLADFGLAQYVVPDIPLYAVCGTPTYVAPEILDGQGYSLEVDVWAVGVLTYILLCGFPPFVATDETDQQSLFSAILAGTFDFVSPYWDSMSEPVCQLIVGMLHVDPGSRYTAQHILQDPWIHSYSRPSGGAATVSKCRAKSAGTKLSRRNFHHFIDDRHRSKSVNRSWN